MGNRELCLENRNLHGEFGLQKDEFQVILIALPLGNFKLLVLKQYDYSQCPWWVHYVKIDI